MDGYKKKSITYPVYDKIQAAEVSHGSWPETCGGPAPTNSKPPGLVQNYFSPQLKLTISSALMKRHCVKRKLLLMS